MPNFYKKYQSFEELYQTFFRGNEIEFKYKEDNYYVLPYFENGVVIGVLFGNAKQQSDSVCYSANDLYNASVDDSIFGEILDKIDVFWCNF